MSKRRVVSSGSPYEPVIGFSRAVRASGIVAVGGTTAGSGGKPVAIGDPAAQTKAILEIIAKALEDAGAGLKDVIRTRIYLVDIAHWEAVGRVHRILRRDPAGFEHLAGDAFHQPGLAGRYRGRRRSAGRVGLEDFCHGAAKS
jgi:enamine deaminase RidA (YjgF/YER057c/UK114 family)